MRRVTQLDGAYSVDGRAFGPFRATEDRPYLEVPDALVNALGLNLHESDPQLIAQQAQADAEEGEGIHVDQILQANTDLKASLDGVYTERAHLIAALSKMWPASLETDATQAEGWQTLVVIDFPTGQGSWHVAPADLDLFAHLPRDAGRVWDGHTTEEKYDRLDDLQELDIVALLDAIGWTPETQLSPADLARNIWGASETNREQLALATDRARQLESWLDEAKAERDVARTERDAAKAQADATPAIPGPVILPDGLRADLIALKGISEQRADEILGMVNAALNPAPAPAPEADAQ